MPSIPSVPLMRASPSFSASSTGCKPVVGQRLGGGAHDSRIDDVALTHHGQGAVRERREVAGAAEAAVLEDDR